MKSVLIITYYWPPAGGPGVQRWLKFVKYFEEFGIRPIVYTPQNPNYPILDSQLVQDIPETVEIIKFPIKEPYRFANLFSKKKTQTISRGMISEKKSSVLEDVMLFVRGNFFIPDARVGWVKPSIKFLSDYLETHSVDAIVTTGPPHSLHLIGYGLKKKFNLPWIADFRDPWTTIHYHKALKLTKSAAEKHKKLEKLVLDSADCIVVTGPTTKKEFSRLTETPIEVITNGFDVSIEIRAEEIKSDSEFSIAHIGSLLSHRNPEILWEALSELSAENPQFKSDLVLKFAGVVGDDIKESLATWNLLSRSEFRGYVSHSEVLKLQRKSRVLLLIEMNRNETRAIIPGKIFEYLAAKRPILALGPEGSDIEGILRETDGGVFFNYFDKEALKSELLNLYLRFKKGNLSVESKNIEKYSRKNLTARMAKLIHSLTT